MKGIVVAAVLSMFAVGCTGESDGGPKKGPVSVTVYFDGLVVSGASVVFHDADGVPLVTLATAADGRATFEDTPRGGMVTIAYKPEDKVFIRTFAGLDPGEELVVVLRQPVLPFVIVDTLDVALPPFAGATDYNVGAGCTSAFLNASTSGSQSFEQTCLDVGAPDLVATALADGVILAYALLLGVDMQASTSVSFPSWTAAVPADLVIEATSPNVLGGGASLEIQHGGERRYGMGESFAAAPGPFTLDLGVASGIGNFAVRQAALQFGATTPESFSIINDSLAFPLPATSSLAEGDFLPPLLSIVASTAGGFSISWDGDVGDADGVLAGFQFGDLAEWEIFVPPSAADGGVVAPALPAEITALLSGGLAGHGLFVVDTSFTDGFDELRPLVALGDSGLTTAPVGERVRLVFAGF